VSKQDGGRERQRQQRSDGPAQAALPGKVADEERQHEQTQVAGVEGVLARELQAQQLGRLDGRRRCDRQADHDNGLGTGDARLPGRGFGVGRHDELLPQPVRVLAGELARKRIKAAHALDRHEERLVSGQPRLGETGDLVAQVPFQLLDIGPVDRPAAAQISTPLGDLLLERQVIDARVHTVTAFIQMA
jgi:hypothetical protein